ncbi:X-ray radiation resistance-associated protein 1 isoform X2 [Plectropomus leopardus]|uniref:X-ray radiation resistance-associated protein 1 isoform X2 n=1 Tax=Plectropomus leopardus TaxID=160734 RepID=UPI001C4BB02A|nr:X-ray radiation resistance-associated protein 1 isoform X2 [Plectropomus leopardus]XP_042354598.1 X-ray radiation resistance-associated protein 1 isoform X2 [Plectropomus leopardus]
MMSTGAGHWLVAYRNAEEQKYRTVRRRIKETYKACENDRDTHSPNGNTLDGPFLLQLHCVDKPSELCTVDISEQKLNSVKQEELKVFDNVAYIDASINSLSLGSFSSFVSLRELNLSLNGLCNMTFNAADFPHLKVLDLSYNSLSADDIVSIGQLPHLKVLHLTGNELHNLPPDLGSSSHSPTQLPAEEEDTRCKALEILMLDDNKLSSGVFNSLANLKRLKYLNLQGNRISEIPYLQLTGCSKPWQTSIDEPAEEDGLAHTEPNPKPSENFRTMSKISHKENWDEHCQESGFPLPELQFLNLADNKIAEEDAVMAASLFPMLRKIDIHSNPLTTQRSGDPPLLTCYLQERLGIKIKRKKTQEVVKHPLKVSADPKWKVEERNPKVSKRPMLMGAPCPAQTYVEKSEADVERKRESESENRRDDTLQENTEPFFVTQATDVPEYKFDLQTDEKETTENKDDIIPEKFPCYKMLMDAKPNPDVVEPIGIQTAVRMLEHTLRNLNVYRDAKPKLDSIQTPYRGREKRIKELAPLKPIKQPTERVDELIREIRNSTTIREVPLSSAIHGTGVNKQEHEEALSLLRDMKTKHKMVHEKSMKLAATIESDRNTENGADPPPAQIL